MVSRFDAFNNCPARKAARKVARAAKMDEVNAIDRCRRSWTHGAFDLGLLSQEAAALPESKRKVSFAVLADSQVTLFCGITRSFVYGRTVRRVNMRTRGFFFLCRLQDGTLTMAPVSFVFTGCIV